MIPHVPLAVPTLRVSNPHRLHIHPVLACLSLSPLACFALFPISTPAQAPQQQYVYASVPVTTKTSEVSAFVKNSADGSLAPTTIASVPDKLEGGLLTVDAKGRFVFLLNSTTSKISMFAIDPNTGNLNEVPGSPFAAGVSFSYPQAPTSPSCLAVEPSGQFLYVGYDYGNINGMGSINAFQIDSGNLQLLPLPTLPTWDIASSPIGLLSTADGRFLYAGLGINRVTGAPASETLVYKIDPVSGQLESNGFAGNALGLGRSIAIDPHAHFFFQGWGLTTGHIDSAPISPADGTATIGVSTLNLNSGELPQALLPESSGRFLYVQQTTGVAAYSIDPSTGALSQTQPPSPLLSFHTGQAAADPLGPYLYVLQSDGVHGFQVDPQAGALSELPNSPFATNSNGIRGIAISGNASSVQPISGPIAALFPSSQSFGSVPVGQSSNAKMITLTNTGDQLLLISKISVGGTNASDFVATPTCNVSLPSDQTCTISVTFTPTGTGARQATLTVVDNTSAGSQAISLTGTGVAQQPDVTLSPSSFTFPTPMNQGATSQPQSVSVTNDGTATLHITSIAIDSTTPNASDFSLTANTCSSTLAVKSTCVLTATFSPLGNGARTANVLVVDDAPGSPQQIPLTGTGQGAPVTHPGISFNPTAVTFPATSQGSSSPAQSLTITSSGTGTLHITSIAMAGSNPGDFPLTNNCSSPAYVPQATCTVSLTFTPSTVAATLGPRSATLLVTDDAPNSPQTIAISGTSTDAGQPVSSSPSVQVNSGNSQQTIKAGATATWTLSLTPNFTGSLSFGCQPPIATITCSAPISTDVTSSTPISVQIAVATIGPAAASPGNIPEASPTNPQQILILGLLFVLVAMTCLSTRKAFRRRSGFEAISYSASRPWLRLPLVSAMGALLAVSATGFTSGCGGGFTTAQGVPITQPAPAPTTPQGTYTITLALTPIPTDGKPHTPLPSIPLTLTVQ